MTTHHKSRRTDEIKLSTDNPLDRRLVAIFWPKKYMNNEETINVTINSFIRHYRINLKRCIEGMNSDGFSAYTRLLLADQSGLK
jgi:hypothetical protein